MDDFSIETSKKQGIAIRSNWLRSRKPAMAISNVLCLVIAGVFVGVNAVDYCKLCNGTHTMCVYPSPTPAPQCKEPHDVGLSNAEKDKVMRKHNELRQRVASGRERRGKPGPQPPAARMPDLTWDNELEMIAQRWTNQGILRHDECRHVERFKVGQNIAMSAAIGQEPQDLEGMIQAWYDEVKLFNKRHVKSYEYSLKTAHYTQMVWGDTVKIGCGRIKYKNEKNWDTILFICNYGPAGNWKRKPMYEIRK